jgi:hypothetical protein
MYNGIGNRQHFEEILRESVSPKFLDQPCAAVGIHHPGYNLIPYDTFVHFGSVQFERKLVRSEEHWWNQTYIGIPVYCVGVG